MTPEQRAVVFGLVHRPGRPGPEREPNDVLRAFGTDDGRNLGLHLLAMAVDERDSDDVEAALLVSKTFGFGPGHLPLLLQLAYADWHVSHEDVVWYLGQYGGPDVVAALSHAVEWVPDYLEFDEARALARKAIWELSKQPGSLARLALQRAAESGPEGLREEASELLRR